MANEITLTASLSVFKAAIMSTSLGRSVTGAQFSMAGNTLIGPTTLNVLTSDTLIPLGGVTAPHWAYFRNMDSVNFLKLKTASAGAYFAKLLAGEYAFFPLLDTNAAIMAIADTASVFMEYMIINL